MRTGSPRNAYFKGQHRREYAWFTISDSLPVLSIRADYAARKILEACRRGSARLLLGPQAKAAALLNELFPGATAALLAMANRWLPSPAGTGPTGSFAGHESQSALAPSRVTRLNERAAARNNQLG